MKKQLIFIAALAMVVSCQKEGKEDGPKENPNPTTIEGVTLVKTEIAVDPEGFNMLTDGGFERFAGDENWKQKSLWYLPDYVSEAETAYSGARTLHGDCNSRDWRDLAIQSICLKKNSSYTYTQSYRGAWNGLNVYMGFRGAATHDVNLNTTDVGSEWKEYSYTYANTDDVKVNVFMGGFCWDNLWLEADDFKVIPTGTENDSFIPQNAAVVASSISNASFTELASAVKVIAWIEADGSVSAVINSADGNHFVSSNDSDITDGIKINLVAENPFAEGLTPTTGISINGKKYVRAYGYVAPVDATEENPNPDWTIDANKLFVSENGIDWTETATTWANEGNFVKVNYLLKENKVYMFGSAAGDNTVTTYVARVDAANIENAAEYEYFDGGEWVKGDETAAAPICYGPIDNMSVVYNADRYTYMMIYRSKTTDCLVYRDAGVPEGEWSGEKILMADPTDTALCAPQVLAVSSNAIYFLSSAK